MPLYFKAAARVSQFISLTNSSNSSYSPPAIHYRSSLLILQSLPVCLCVCLNSEMNRVLKEKGGETTIDDGQGEKAPPPPTPPPPPPPPLSGYDKNNKKREKKKKK